MTITAVAGMPVIQPGDDVGRIIAESVAGSGRELADGDVLCIASKIISVAEDRLVRLDEIRPTEGARRLHARIPRKDVRILQLIIQQTGDPTGRRVVISDSHVAGWLPNGLLLTSAGIDKVDADSVLLLPIAPDASATRIAARILDITGHRISVIITDSDGRRDKRGATQVAIGVHGIAPLRDDHGEETICDMLAAAAAVVMGQREAGCPVAICRGVSYIYQPDVRIDDALHNSNKINIGRQP